MTTARLAGLDVSQVWDTELAFAHLNTLGEASTKRTAERRLQDLGFLPPVLEAAALRDEQGRSPTPAVLAWDIERARRRRRLVLFVQIAPLPDGRDCLFANDARGTRYWYPFEKRAIDAVGVRDALARMQAHIGKEVSYFGNGSLVAALRDAPLAPNIEYGLLSYPPQLDLSRQASGGTPRGIARSPYMHRLEAESIHIIREAVAEAENPAMLYSMGKDSAVMLHLARKAFFPSPPPLPLLHVDTRWKFQEMYLFRDQVARESGMELLVHINPEAIAKDINPFDHGSALHTDITKTEGLKQALEKHRFDVVFGGARRDEEKSRAKERVFSFRSRAQRWDPKNQRPELWNLYNTRKAPGESIRVFPLSNWTELDVWQYILQEQIAVVPLYFARERPVVVRDGMIMMVDDARMRLLPGEEIEVRKIRFRTLGCYPLTGAIESNASTVADLIEELLVSHSSERQGRLIDSDVSASMEKKKAEGYF